MRLEPVYLVAPKPKRPSIPTRRAFLISGGAFVFGALAGGACGYAAGASTASANSSPSTATPTKPEDLVLEPSGDADLDELRRLAVKAPIEELVEKGPLFLGLINDTYAKDEILWRGVERLSNEILQNEATPRRRLLARTITMIAQLNKTMVTSGLDAKLAALQRVR